MALTSTTMRALYNANGVTTVFAIPGTIIESDSTEILVYTRDESTTPATELLKVEGALQAYTLTGASPPTTPFDTDVTFNTAPASGLKVLVIRQVARTQSIDLNSNSEVIAGTTIETALDRVTAITQQLQEQIDRAPKFQITSSKTAIPLPEPSASLLLQWNAAATGVENGVSSATIAGYATNASTSETNAATSATNAATSATNAATSASTATTQASNASTSATNAAASATALGAPAQANKVMAGPASGADATATFRLLVGADLPNPSAAALGGVQSKDAVSNQFLTSISTSGVPASAQPSASDLSNGVTGSGAVVLATTPTLVTPVLGAATGTSLSVSGQLTSTVTTGTAPLVVSSTTLVANLKSATAGNADTVTTNANLTGDITSSGNATTYAGTVALNKGGTGQVTKAAAFDALQPMTTGGDIIYGGASGVATRLANGNSGQVLTSGGTTVAPTWTTVAGASTTSIRLNTGNGFGSTNTKIRRFTNVTSTTGSDITYTDSAANGASFTINTSGLYSFTYADEGNTGSPHLGISFNSSQLTTDLYAITVASRLVISNFGNGNERGSVSWTGYLAAESVIRPHTNSGTAGFITSPATASFTAAGPL